MANLFEHTDRRVIPNWRSFGKTSSLGELNSFRNERPSPKQETTIDEYIIDWQLNKTTTHASDLLSAALVNNQKENTYAFEAAHFILANQEKASISQISLANQFLNNESDVELTSIFENVNLDNLNNVINHEPVRAHIRDTKNALNFYPNNPILYVELSRYYSMLGQEINSMRAMKTALHLAPNNRFVLRCATRLFAHFNNANNDYLDYVHKILKRNPMTAIDPWLTSAEISIATIRNIPSRFIKKGIDIINSKNISPFNFTELASSLGTVELLFGGTKRSREFFKKSLLSPNDNSLAQIEWASTKDKHLEITPANFNVKMNFEALALDSFQNENYDLALENAIKWFIDMPFSKRSIMFGSSLASTILRDQKKSILFLNYGLISHPNDPQLINNLAYALALDNRPNDANELISKLRNEPDYDEITKIYLTATKGLIQFRSGNPESGRYLYLKAIEQTLQKKDQELYWVAILNYAREEIILNSEYATSVMNAVAKIPPDTKIIEIRALRKDVVDLYDKMKQKNG